MESRQTKIKIPTRRSLFWDVPPKNIDPQKHAVYIIERVLEHGLDKEIRWMWHAYSRPLIRNVVLRSRIVTPKTRSLWELLTKTK